MKGSPWYDSAELTSRPFSLHLYRSSVLRICYSGTTEQYFKWTPGGGGSKYSRWCSFLLPYENEYYSIQRYFYFYNNSLFNVTCLHIKQIAISQERRAIWKSYTCRWSSFIISRVLSNKTNFIFISYTL